VIGALILVALGYSAARALLPNTSWRLRLGSGILIGAGLCGVILLFTWSLVGCSVAALLGCWALWRTHRSNPATQQPSNHWTDVLTLTTLALYAWHSTRPEEWSWQNSAPSKRDWFFIWGQKANLFFAHGGIDVAFLQSSPRDLSQPDYPWLWPLTIDWLALFHGSFDPRLAGLATVLFALALLLVFREFASPLATLAATGAACTSYLGLADGPFAAFAGAALILADDALRRDDRHRLRVAAILLGLSANIKNEGVALIIAVAIAIVVAGRARRVVELWPALAIAAPWLIAKRALGLSTDLLRGDLVARLTHSLAHLGEFFARFRDVHESNPWLYLAIGFALLISIRELRRETFLVTAIVAQLTFYLAANLISPFGVGGQIGGSWGRLLGHVAVPLVFLAARGLEVHPRAATAAPSLVEEEGG
jgi:hypothetical protein